MTGDPGLSLAQLGVASVLVGACFLAVAVLWRALQSERKGRDADMREILPALTTASAAMVEFRGLVSDLMRGDAIRRRGDGA